MVYFFLKMLLPVHMLSLLCICNEKSKGFTYILLWRENAQRRSQHVTISRLMFRLLSVPICYAIKWPLVPTKKHLSTHLSQIGTHFHIGDWMLTLYLSLFKVCHQRVNAIPIQMTTYPQLVMTAQSLTHKH